MFTIPNTTRHALALADIRLFDSTWRSNQNDQAADTMRSRSHFYDAATMRFFGCRVAHSCVIFDGLVMAAVMSQKAGPRDTDGRVWRFAAHDCTGRALHEDNDYNTRQQAEKASAVFLATLKPKVILRDIIKREKDSAARKLAAIRAVKIGEVK